VRRVRRGHLACRLAWAPSEVLARVATHQARVFGIELLGIRFKRINYNVSVCPKIYDRMISERRRIYGCAPCPATGRPHSRRSSRRCKEVRQGHRRSWSSIGKNGLDIVPRCVRRRTDGLARDVPESSYLQIVRAIPPHTCYSGNREDKPIDQIGIRRLPISTKSHRFSPENCRPYLPCRYYGTTLSKRFSCPVFLDSVKLHQCTNFQR
jgi:hypothetical protein